MGVFDKVFKFGDGSIERPYFPLHTVRALDLEPTIESPHPVNNPGQLALNGYIAGTSNGGAVLLGGKEWGSDFVAAEGDARQVYLLPTDKAAIEVENPEENIGSITQEGISILTAGDLFIVTAVYTANEWRASSAAAQGARVAQTGGLWCIQSGIPRRGEMTSVDSSGITLARWLPS